MEKVNSLGSIRRKGGEIFAAVQGASGERLVKVGKMVLGQYVPSKPDDWEGGTGELAKLWAEAQAALTAGRLKGIVGFIKRAF